jgi:phosphatidate cytidylyltransferase
MHPVVYYILIFLAIGGAGMAIANRKAGKAIRQQRWLKYFTYIIFTGAVVAGIFYNFFYWLVWLIAACSLLELSKVNFSKPIKPYFQISASFMFYLIIAAGFILFASTFNKLFILFIYFQVLVFDGFCQITGQLFGKHQLVPKISPAKTVEGLIGGWLCCLIAAIIASDWVPIDRLTALLFGLLTGLTCFTGDLLASWYKRKVMVKDFSNWLPGQGGFLDRFDSFLCTASIYYLLYITIFSNGFDFVTKP